MRLPNADRAVVDIAKLRDYCLNTSHSEGKFKARVFQAALGITSADAEMLREWLLAAARNQDAVAGTQDEFGNRFVVDFAAVHRSRSAHIRSAWIIRTGEVFPRLVTSYVL
jgi:hypothetical protein